MPKKTAKQLTWRSSPEVFNRVEWARKITGSTLKEIVEACLSRTAIVEFVNKKVPEMEAEAKRATAQLKAGPPAAKPKTPVPAQ